MTEEQIKDIAENLELGLKCFIHKETKDIKFIPDTDQYPDDSGVWDADIEEIEDNLDDYIEIEGMPSGESFRLMTGFTGTVDDPKVRQRLEQALGKPKPFKNFKFQIDNSGAYREEWFKFRAKRLIDWTAEQVKENGL